MKDLYPTRKSQTGSFMNRVDPISFTQFPYYEERGYIVLRSFFSHIDLAHLADADGLVTMEPGQSIVRSRTGVHLDRNVAKIASHRALISQVENILGEGIYIHQSRINYKAAISGSGWSWHSDFETWHAQDGMPRMRCLTAMIPLTENTNVNGSLMVIPGSHKYFYSCKKEREFSAEENFADQKEGVPPNEAIAEFYKICGYGAEMITCNPGDLVLFDCNLIHVSTPNLSPDPRTNLFIVYNSLENMLVTPFSATTARPEEMGARKNIITL